MTSLRAPLRAPAPDRRTEADPRPRLRVVPPDALSPAGRRRRARLVALTGFAVLVLTAFGIATLHVVVTQGQFRLDRVNDRAAAEQARYERMRLQVAELEAPGRVVAAAQERLGMVPPPGVTYLAPTGIVTEGQDDDATADDTESASRSGAPLGSWDTVKPHLAARP